MKTSKYYFSFGSSEFFPYRYGFVTIYADTLKDAAAKYRSKYPDITTGIVNCSFMYHESQVADPLESFGGEEWDVIA